MANQAIMDPVAPVRRRRAPWGAAVSVTGVALGFAALFAMLGDDAGDDPNFVVLAMTIGWGFIGTGVYASLRRPDSRIGLLMTCVGFSWLLGVVTMAMRDEVFSLGVVVYTLWAGFLVHMIVGFPTGRLRGRLEWATVLLAYVSGSLLQAAPWLFASTDELCRDSCPRNLLILWHDLALAQALQTVGGLAMFAAMVMACAILIAHWRAAGPRLRYVLEPVLWLGTPTIGFQAASDLLEGVGVDASHTLVLEIAGVVTFALVPFAFLTGLLRSRLHEADVVAALGRQLRGGLEPGRLREALAEALGDPALTLAYWLPERGRFVDGSGTPVELPRAGAGRAATIIEDGERPVAALVYDAALPDAPDLARLAGDAALVWLENERLEAELRARITDLRESRARLVHTADAERRRIERDLHDGAQQRLASLLLTTKLERRRQPPNDGSPLLDAVERGLVEALEDLRVLAAGILPPILADQGLGVAVKEIAGRTPVAVDVLDTPDERLPPSVEVAAYFVIAEALTNVVKHAGAAHATVRVSRRDGSLTIEVTDDGRGGASDGSGLRGLADRVGALDGRLVIDSPPGSGTRLCAEIPCAS